MWGHEIIQINGAARIAFGYICVFIRQSEALRFRQIDQMHMSLHPDTHYHTSMVLFALPFLETL